MSCRFSWLCVSLFRFTAEWDLTDPSWRYDAIPEIVDGKNVLDYIDPDILEKLAELEVCWVWTAEMNI